MPICDSCGNDCGNDYDKRFTITKGNVSGTFDNFECAPHNGSVVRGTAAAGS